MQRVDKVLGPGRMRLLGGAGALIACGVAGVTVAAAPKPADAPLKPPVDPGKSLAGAPSQTQTQSAASATPGLVIPATPVCAGGAAGGAPAPVSVDPSLQPILAQLRATTTRAQRLAILQGLTPEQRGQILPLLQRHPGAGAARCAPSATASPGATQAPMIEPDIVDGGATPAPVTSTYVS